MNSYSVTTHLSAHAHSFEYFCRVRTSTNRTRLTGTIVLTVSSLAYTTKTMSFNNALETFTFGGSDNVYEVNVIEQIYSNSITEIQFILKSFELSQVLLGRYSGFFEVTHQRLRSMLFLLLLER